MIEISLDPEDAIAKIEDAFRHLKDSNRANYAISVALNKSMRAAKKESIELLQKIYSMPKDEAQKYMSIRKATSTDLWTELRASGRGSRLINFQDGLNRKGVYVKIKGQRVFMKGMFIKRTRQGFFSIFARGYQKNYNPVFRTKRVRAYPRPDLPIVSLRTISPFKAITMDIVSRSVEEKTMNRLNKTIDKQIKDVLTGKGWDG